MFCGAPWVAQWLDSGCSRHDSYSLVRELENLESCVAQLINKLKYFYKHFYSVILHNTFKNAKLDSIKKRWSSNQLQLEYDHDFLLVISA